MKTGDLQLDALWGPFSRHYLGISGILDPDNGIMLDAALNVSRRAPHKLISPDHLFGYEQHHGSGNRRGAVEAAPAAVGTDYRHFSMRYFLDRDGDTVLADYKVVSPCECRCTLTFSNSAECMREYGFGLGLVVQDARKRVFLQPAYRAGWLPARNYTHIEAYRKTFGIGCRQCLTRVFDWGVEDQVLAQAFGGWPEDLVEYRMKLPRGYRDAVVYLRYVKYGRLDHPWEMTVNGRPSRFSLPQTSSIHGGAWGKNKDAYAEWKLLGIPVGELADGQVSLALRPIQPPGNDRAQIWLDGFLFHEGRLPGDNGGLLPACRIDAPLAETATLQVEERCGARIRLGAVLPAGRRQTVELVFSEPPGQELAGQGSLIMDCRRRHGLPPPAVAFRDAETGNWLAWESAPVQVAPRARKTVEFRLILRDSDALAPEAEAVAAPSAGAVSGPFAELAAGLRDVMLVNINYPMNVSGRPSHIFVPSKYFPIPYSWDNGFTALGMATFAPELAERLIRYFLADEDVDYPLLYCGSPVPTQLYALWDLYQNNPDPELLRRNYSGARRMTDFYLGRTPGSVVNLHDDGMLSTYPYCYNLGMDDHPLQLHAEQQHLTGNGLYSLILMAQVLRNVLIMRNLAHILGKSEDLRQWNSDAALLGGIINTQMWDERSGLYGWLVRTAAGVVKLEVDGSCGDRTACSFLPLFAGITMHADRLLPLLEDPRRFATPFGISSVDMAAPYYSENGYWNGGIWPVIQWYIWRGLLECGQAGPARKVAETILDTWQTAFKNEHYLGEHFMIKPRQMQGTPNFGGLSSVLLPMQAAYSRPYMITVPYNVILLEQNVRPSEDRLEVTVDAGFQDTAEFVMLVNMGRRRQPYRITAGGKTANEVVSDDYGHLAVNLPVLPGQFRIAISEVPQS